MQAAECLNPERSLSSGHASRGSLTGGHPDMTPFVEIQPEPEWPAAIRKTLCAQPDEYFRKYFQGRLPEPAEKRTLIEDAVRMMTPIRAFENNLYRVEIARSPTPFIHLRVRRLDGGTCNEWSDLQRIKNEIVGAEYEAVELFPSESRLVNTANEYHLWVHPDPTYRFPLGWVDRAVLSEQVKLCDDPPTNQPVSLDGVRPKRQTTMGPVILTPIQQQTGSLVLTRQEQAS